MKVALCDNCDETLKKIHQILKLLCYIRSDKVFNETTSKVEFWEHVSKLRTDISEKRHIFTNHRRNAQNESDKKSFKEQSSQTDVGQESRIPSINSDLSDDSGLATSNMVKIEILDSDNEDDFKYFTKKTTNAQTETEKIILKEQSSQTDMNQDSRTISRKNSDASDVSGMPRSNLVGLQIIDSENDDEFTIYKEPWFLEAELALLGDNESTEESPQENNTDDSMKTDSTKEASKEVTGERSLEVTVKAEIKEEMLEETVELIDSPSNDSSNGTLRAPNINTSSEKETTIPNESSTANENDPINKAPTNKQINNIDTSLLSEMLKLPQSKMTQSAPVFNTDIQVNTDIQMNPQVMDDYSKRMCIIYKAFIDVARHYARFMKPTLPADQWTLVCKDFIDMNKTVKKLMLRNDFKDHKKFLDRQAVIEYHIEGIENKLRGYVLFAKSDSELGKNTNPNQIPYQISAAGINVTNGLTQKQTPNLALNVSHPPTVIPVPLMQINSNNVAPNVTVVARNPILNEQRGNAPPYYIHSHQNAHQGVRDNRYFETHLSKTQKPNAVTPQVNKSPTASGVVYNHMNRSPHHLNIITPPPTPNTNQQITYSNQIQSPCNQNVLSSVTNVPIQSIMKSPVNNSMQSGNYPLTQIQQQVNSVSCTVPYPHVNSQQNHLNYSHTQTHYSQIQTNMPLPQTSFHQQQMILPQSQMNIPHQSQSLPSSQTNFLQHQTHHTPQMLAQQQANLLLTQTNNPQSQFSFTINQPSIPQTQTGFPLQQSNHLQTPTNNLQSQSNLPHNHPYLPHNQPYLPQTQNNFLQNQPYLPQTRNNFLQFKQNSHQNQQNPHRNQQNSHQNQQNLHQNQQNLLQKVSNFHQAQTNSHQQSYIAQSQPHRSSLPSKQQSQQNMQQSLYTFQNYLESQQQQKPAKTTKRSAKNDHSGPQNKTVKQ